MPQLAELQRTWTFEDLERFLPDDVDWRCYEIVDGGLVVSPPPGFDHEFVIDQVRTAFRQCLPADLWASPGGVDLYPSYRVPDLVVVPRAFIGQRRKLVLPHEVSVAVEVVSPGSRTTDRITKPAEYAAAGIPAYWRVETDPEVTLTAYVLEPGADVYTELGTWGPGQTAEIDRPFAVRIEIDTLIPTA